MIEDALVAGLLHDLGKLVLVANLPAPYNKAQALAHGKNMLLCEAEQEVLGGTHAEVGAYLIGLWGITNSIVEALAFHHNPDRCAAKTFTLVTAVHVADVLANEVYPVETGVEVKVDADYLAKTGLTERLPYGGNDAWRCIGSSLIVRPERPTGYSGVKPPVKIIKEYKPRRGGRTFCFRDQTIINFRKKKRGAAMLCPSVAPSGLVIFVFFTRGFTPGYILSALRGLL